MTWDPENYPTTIRNEIHDYDELQERIAQATVGMAPRYILDLGVGAGETSQRVLQKHPEARLVGIDSSAAMLRGAEKTLPRGRVALLQQGFDAPLPDQPFDLVISALAIHHLEGEAKGGLFRKLANRLVPGGSFVMGDVVIPSDPSAALIEIGTGYDFPSTIEELLRQLAEAGFSAEIVWLREDLAVVKAELAKTQ